MMPIIQSQMTPRRGVRIDPLHAGAILIFLGTTAYTIYGAHAMAGGMKMPGGWEMSMMWMPMAGQSTLGFAAMFIAMWAAMMIAMMLPSAMPMLLIYRKAITNMGQPHPNLRTAMLGLGYFGIWSALGAAVWAIGLGLARWEMTSEAVSRAVPMVGGATLIVCGVYQWTKWKSSCLKHCRDPLCMIADHLHDGAAGALRMGIAHGTFCALCCWSLMLMQIVLGIMNLAAMAGIALVIALEKLLPMGMAVARVVGAIAVIAGIVICLR
jgi:predicted metal-binding membrane protein